MSISKLKVLFIPAWYPHRHDQMAGLFIQRHARTLAPFADVAVLHIVQHPAIKRHLMEELQEDGIYVYRIYLKQVKIPFVGSLINFLNYTWAGSYAFKQIMAKWGKPQLTHAHVLTRSAWLAGKIKKKYGIPYLISEHWSRYFPANSRSYKGWLRKRITRKLVKEAEAVLPVSRVLQNAMQAQELQNLNYEVVPNVVDMEGFNLKTAGSKPGSTAFINVSCFDEKSKNLKSLLDAFGLLITEGENNLSLKLVGDGPDRTLIEEYVKMKQLNAFVSFSGELKDDQLQQAYRDADVFVLNSRYETFGTVIIEALACGLPVISTKVGIAPELISDKTGKLISHPGITPLKDALLWMHEHKQEFKPALLRATVEDRYSYHQVGRQLAEVYKRILKP